MDGDISSSREAERKLLRLRSLKGRGSGSGPAFTNAGCGRAGRMFYLLGPLPYLTKTWERVTSREGVAGTWQITGKTLRCGSVGNPEKHIKAKRGGGRRGRGVAGHVGVPSRVKIAPFCRGVPAEVGGRRLYRLIGFLTAWGPVNYSQPQLCSVNTDSARADVIPSSLAFESHMPACKHTCSRPGPAACAAGLVTWPCWT